MADAVGLLLRELGATPLIGFAGAPFTLASYLVEGGPSRNHERTKALMHAAPDVWHALMGRLADITATFLRAQVDAGVDAVQLFDSWAGALSLRDYREYVLPHSARVLAGLADAGVPRIHFGVGTGELLGAMAEAGADVVGVDWRVPLRRGRPADRRHARPAGQPRPGGAVRRTRRRSRRRRAASSPRAAPRPGTCSTWATACCRERTRTSSPGSSSWCTAWSRELLPRVAVVGGGISGLAAAHRLRTLLGPAAEIVVLEQRDRLGGVLRTVDLAGVPYDVGAEAFLWRRPEVRELLDELGLAGEVVHPAGAAAVGAGRRRHRAAADRHAAGGADERRPARRCAVRRQDRAAATAERDRPLRLGGRAATSRSAGCCGSGSATSWPTGWPTRCSAASTRAGWTRSACARRCRRSPRRWTRARPR